MQQVLKVDGDAFLLEEIAAIMANSNIVIVALKGSSEDVEYAQSDAHVATKLRDGLISQWERYLAERAEQRERSRQQRELRGQGHPDMRGRR